MRWESRIILLCGMIRGKMDFYSFNQAAELELIFADKPYAYMIIIYQGHCSFQRCGNIKEASGEYRYSTLDELYKAQQIDDIILEKDWNQIIDIYCIDFDILGLW